MHGQPVPECGRAIIVLGALQLTIEVQIDQARQPAGLAPVINFNPVHTVRIKTQLDFQGTQTQVHLVKGCVDAHGAVFAHRSLDPSEKERLQLQACIKIAQAAGSLCKTELRTYSGRTMRTQLIDSLDPVGELCV